MAKKIGEDQIKARKSAPKKRATKSAEAKKARAKPTPTAKPATKPKAKPKTAAKPTKSAVKKAVAKQASKAKPAKTKPIAKKAQKPKATAKPTPKPKPIAKKAPKALKAKAKAKPKPKQKAKKLTVKPKSVSYSPSTRLPEGYFPSEREEFMNPLQIEYFRQKLLRWREELLDEANSTLSNLSDENFQKPDITDRAQIESDTSLQLRARDRERKLLSKIEAALRRIEEGTYGYCEETDEPISLKRLEARPIASLSLDAQERHERLERIHRDD